MVALNLTAGKQVTAGIDFRQRKLERASTQLMSMGTHSKALQMPQMPSRPDRYICQMWNLISKSGTCCKTAVC
jgi:hypothetical protein